MSIKTVMNIKGISFSPKYSSGSAAERNKTLQNIRDNIFARVVSRFEAPHTVDNTYVKYGLREYVPIAEIRKVIKESLPEKLRLDIKKTQNGAKDYDACLNTHVNNRDASVSYYSINIPAMKNHLHIDSIPTVMHEITHLLDMALYPQYNNSLTKIFKKGLPEKVYELFDKVYYTQGEFLKFKILKKTKEFMKGLSVEDKLLVLKFLELELKTEAKAKSCTEKYINFLRTHQKRKCRYNPVDYSLYNFEKKIKLVKKMRYKIISKERKKIAKKH